MGVAVFQSLPRFRIIVVRGNRWEYSDSTNLGGAVHF
jgi:hypothetical protein